ncbi:MAG: universal stress protein [Candidatus Methanosuratincola petrocarbonis]
MKQIRDNRIVVAVDLSPVSDSVVGEASEIAKALNSDVQLISVIPVPGLAMAEGDLDRKDFRIQEEDYAALHRRLVEKHFSDSKLLVETRILYGDPAKKIAEYAEKTNSRLIVLGNRGMGKIQSFLLGSTSEGVIRNSRVSVLVVKK